MESHILAAQTGMALEDGRVAFGETIQKSQLLRYKQDVTGRPLGVMVIRATVVINSQALIQVLSFLISVFFLLLNMKYRTKV